MCAQYFEDLAVGDRLAAGPYRIEREEMLAFAQRYDPRPVHLDEAAGAASVFGALVASGIYTLAVWNRLRFEAEASLSQIAGLSLEEVRYSAPVRADDRLDLAAECTAKRPSASQADRGVMAFQHRLFNQHGEVAMTAVVNLLVARRPAWSCRRRLGLSNWTPQSSLPCLPNSFINQLSKCPYLFDARPLIETRNTA